MAKAAAATVRMFKSSIGVPEIRRQPLVALLNQHLANVADLHSQVKWAHWNVKASDSIHLHDFFDSVATHLEDHVDTIAERAVALGGVAKVTVREAAAHSALNKVDLAAGDGP